MAFKRKTDSPSKRFTIPARAEYKPINGYGVIGNTRTVSLVGYDGSIDWCCMPNFDSPSVFAALLDRNVGGSWSISPVGSCSSTQKYLKDTNVLQTEFNDGNSTVVMTDFMPCSLHEEAWAYPPEIHRLVECTKGRMLMKLSNSPKFDYARVFTNIRSATHGVIIRCERDEMVLASSISIQANRGKAGNQFLLKEGQVETFVLSYGEYEPRPVDQYQTHSQLLKTEAFWKHWVGTLQFKGLWKEEVTRSALTLKMMVYSPTGAIVAAPTTSLPESIGGQRNWDYRYSWVRDSTNALWAFHVLGEKVETEKFILWLINSNPSLDLDLRVLYTIDGHSDITEKTLGHFEGYRGSKPVRIGNEAVDQIQMDNYRHMLDALYFSTLHGTNVSEEVYYRFVKPLAHFICKNWKRPGNGMWEIRGRTNHYVYALASCYSGLDRAVKIAEMTAHNEDTARWLSVMKHIKKEVLEKGWDSKKKSFVMSYETRELDSANLMLPLMGFISYKDKRMIQTVKAIRKELGKGALLHRYRVDDGFDGHEGAFVLCSFWLVVCLAKQGRVSEAKGIFEKMLAYSNHLGLYAEEIDTNSGEGLGNFPLAFSHMGLIMAAHELNQAMTGY